MSLLTFFSYVLLKIGLLSLCYIYAQFTSFTSRGLLSSLLTGMFFIVLVFLIVVEGMIVFAFLLSAGIFVLDFLLESSLIFVLDFLLGSSLMFVLEFLLMILELLF